MNSDCPYSSEAAAYLADELSESDRGEFAFHLAVCATCRAEVESAERLIAKLRAVPELEASRDLAPLILAKIHEPVCEESQIWRWPRISAIAATIALVAGSSLLWKQGTPTAPTTGNVALVDESTASVDRALDWFCKHQEVDGSWDAAKWGGNARFQIALTALPLIALLEDPQPTPEREAAADRAIVFLRKRQNPDGSFGERFRESPYVQSVTTLALLRAFERRPDPELKRSLDAALKVVLASQTLDGGWGYPSLSAPNLSITLWHRDVVELAARLGWGEVGPSVQRVSHWIASHATTAETANTNPLEISTDYHRAYFMASDLRELNTADAVRNLTIIRQRLISQQAISGVEAGTWAPQDQWGRVGGRIYSTALALLALR